MNFRRNPMLPIRWLLFLFSCILWITSFKNLRKKNYKKSAFADKWSYQFPTDDLVSNEQWHTFTSSNCKKRCIKNKQMTLWPSAYGSRLKSKCLSKLWVRFNSQLHLKALQPSFKWPLQSCCGHNTVMYMYDMEAASRGPSGWQEV